MATQVVELSGDEARLLRSLDKLIAKERDHERKLNDTGKAGEKAGKKIRDSGKAAESGWTTFGKRALGSVAALGGGVFTLSTAVQTVNEFLVAQNELYDRAKEKQLELASVQQESLKNLAGLSEANRLGIIEQAPDIARQTGFRDLGAITSALGSAVSAGGDAESSLRAVTAAATLTSNTPDALDELAGAAIDLQRATGTTDAQANLGFLNLAGTQARVSDPLALAENLAPALVSAVGTVPEQDKIEASRQAAALFAALGKQTADKTGKTTKNAAVVLTAEFKSFFENLEQQRIDARSKITTLDRVKEPTEAQGTERARLVEFLKQAEGLEDPKTIFGRIKALQDSQGIAAQFFSKEFGRAEYKGAFKKIADVNSDISSEMRASFDVIKISREAFEKQAGEIAGATPALTLARIEGQFAAGEATRDVEDSLGALRSLVRTHVDKVLDDTADASFGGMIENMTRGTTFGNLSGSSVAGEAATAFNQVVGRQAVLEEGGITLDEVAKFEQTANALEGFALAIEQGIRLDPDSISEVEGILDNMGRNREIDVFDTATGELEKVKVGDYVDQIFANARSKITEDLDARFEKQLEVQKRAAELQEKQLEEMKRAREANERSAEANEKTAGAIADEPTPTPTPPNYGEIQRGRQ